MKNILIKPVILFVLLTSFLFESYSQITVTKIETINDSSSQDGFIYSLPKTVFKIDIVYEIVKDIKGPLSEYTTEFLGVSNYISSNKVEYNLKDVSVSSQNETDPDQIYYVQYPIERAKDEQMTSFSLSDIGGLLAYNTEAPIPIHNTEIITDRTIIFESGNTEFPYMSQYNKKEKVDTIVRTINIDTVTINRFLFKSSWIDKSIEEKAKDAALQIEKIRESRYQLMTGYHEVNFGSSIIYMDKQIHQLENQYLELFLGKVTKTIEKRTFYFDPSMVKKGDELMKFPDYTSVVIKIVPDNSANLLPDAPSSISNSIYYRIPTSAYLTVRYDDHIFFNGSFVVNQLGSVSTVPLNNTKLQFDKNTGNLISIIRE